MHVSVTCVKRGSTKYLNDKYIQKVTQQFEKLKLMNTDDEHKKMTRAFRSILPNVQIKGPFHNMGYGQYYHG